jgi:hypothetical protein
VRTMLWSLSHLTPEMRILARKYSFGEAPGRVKSRFSVVCPAWYFLIDSGKVFPWNILQSGSVFRSSPVMFLPSNCFNPQVPLIEALAGQNTDQFALDFGLSRARLVQALNTQVLKECVSMEWTTPRHEEIDLNCEVSSYANAEL